MASESSARHTRLNFTQLRRLWEPPGSSEVLRPPSPQKMEADDTEENAQTELQSKHTGLVDDEANVAVKQGSPWSSYEKVYMLRLGLNHRAIVAEEMNPQLGRPSVFSIRKFTDPSMRDKLDVFREIQHKTFVATREIYWLQDTCFVVSEYMPCSLYEIRGNEYLTEVRLAAIIGQVS